MLTQNVMDYSYINKWGYTSSRLFAMCTPVNFKFVVLKYLMFYFHQLSNLRLSNGEAIKTTNRRGYTQKIGWPDFV
jgi:hypothetical protein